MPNIEKIVDTYVLGWNSDKSSARVDLLNQVIAKDCIYFDSHLPEPTIGRDLHCQFIDRFRDKFSDLKLELTSTPSSHHGYFRFTWQMIKSNKEVFIKGNFFGELNEASEINKLVGFVDQI